MADVSTDARDEQTATQCHSLMNSLPLIVNANSQNRGANFDKGFPTRRCGLWDWPRFKKRPPPPAGLLVSVLGDE